MSEISNLEYIRDKGLDEFISEQENTWISSDDVICVHDRKYYQFDGNGRNSGKDP